MANTTTADPDVAALAAAIKAAPMPKGLSAADFCKVWNEVRPLLPVLQTAAALIPVIGAGISAAIGIVIKLGDAAASVFCK